MVDCMDLLFLAALAHAADMDSELFVPNPIAGHAVFDLRVGVDRIGPDHAFLCGELYPLAWLSVEGCGTGSGFLHHGDEPEMAHFRAKARLHSVGRGRLRADFLAGVGFAEVQRTAVDRPGFRFGRASSDDPIEAAGPEAALGVKGRYWADPAGKAYLTADAALGVASIPAAPTVIPGSSPVLPFAAVTVGLGF